jgi:hypothetical protein
MRLNLTARRCALCSAIRDVAAIRAGASAPEGRVYLVQTADRVCVVLAGAAGASSGCAPPSVAIEQGVYVSEQCDPEHPGRVVVAGATPDGASSVVGAAGRQQASSQVTDNTYVLVAHAPITSVRRDDGGVTAVPTPSC